MTAPVTRAARAKVNLLLRILAREAAGYHSIETLFCRLDLADEVTVTRIDQGVELAVSGAETGPAGENLAFRAAELALEALHRPFGVRIDLVKHIPVGAGLGGGSADAAAVLGAVNELAGGRISRAELLHLGARLGADVPFCVSEVPLALAWSRGERLFALPALPPAPVLLVTPPIAVATGPAYGWVDEARSSSSSRGALLLDPAALAAWSDVARMAGNDFESVVFGRIPEVRAAFEALVRTGPLLGRMTGSGSTLFGIYRNTRDRDDARLALGRKHGVLTATATAA